MDNKELEEYLEHQKELEEERKRKYKEELNKDLETMTNANEFLNKYKLDKNEMFDCLAWSLDPKKKALFNDVKRVNNVDRIILVKYEINGKWYWGLPEDEGDQINKNLEENKNE